MTLDEELRAAVSTLEPPRDPAPPFPAVRRRHRRRRTSMLATATVLSALIVVASVVVWGGGGDSPRITSSPTESSTAPTTSPLPPGSDALGLTPQLPEGWTLARGGCPASSTVIVVEAVTAEPTPAGCPDVAGPWAVVQRIPADLHGIDTACVPVSIDGMPVCQATEKDPADDENPLGIARRFYAGLDVLVSLHRAPDGRGTLPDFSDDDPVVLQAVADGMYQAPQPSTAARSVIERALTDGCSNLGDEVARSAVEDCEALELPVGGVFREVGAAGGGSVPATYWVVTVVGETETRQYRVLVESRWDPARRWVTQTVTEISPHEGGTNDGQQCPPPLDPRFLQAIGPNCPGSSTLPDRVALPSTGDEPIGWIDRAALERSPDYDKFGQDLDAAVAAWRRRLIPVSQTRDPSSPTVGFYLQTFGFLDRAVVDDPAFDVDAILAQGACDQGRRIELVDGRPTCTG